MQSVAARHCGGLASSTAVALASLLLPGAVALAELHGTVEDFKVSALADAYQLDKAAEPYSVGERLFVYVKSRGETAIKNVHLECHPHTREILRETVYLRPVRAPITEGVREQAIQDVIAEATGRAADRQAVTELLRSVQLADQHMRGEKAPIRSLPGETMRRDASIERRIGPFYIAVEARPLGEYFVSIEHARERDPVERRRAAFHEKLERGDAESYLLRGAVLFRRRWLSPDRKEWALLFQAAARCYAQALAQDPQNLDARLLLRDAQRVLADPGYDGGAVDAVVKRHLGGDLDFALEELPVSIQTMCGEATPATP